MKYDIQVNPLNPVEYLACCGVFEILARFDVTATSWWEVERYPRFWFESEFDETSLLVCLTQTLGDWNQWQKQKYDANDEILISEDSEESLTDFEESDIEESEITEGLKLNPQFS